MRPGGSEFGTCVLGSGPWRLTTRLRFQFWAMEAQILIGIRGLGTWRLIFRLGFNLLERGRSEFDEGSPLWALEVQNRMRVRGFGP